MQDKSPLQAYLQLALVLFVFVANNMILIELQEIWLNHCLKGYLIIKRWNM